MNREQTPSKQGEPGAGLEVVQGTIERVTYADPTSLYSVLKIDPEKGYVIPAGRGPFRPERVTAVGRVEAPSEGVRVRLEGRWTEHRSHGLQFEFELLEVLQPRDRYGLVRYLSSSRFPGIGEKTAERIVEKLGENALEVILADPKSLGRRARAQARDARGARRGTLRRGGHAPRERLPARAGPRPAAERGGDPQARAGLRDEDPRRPLRARERHPGHRLRDRRPRARGARDRGRRPAPRARGRAARAALASEEGHTLLGRERPARRGARALPRVDPAEALADAVAVLVEQRDLVEEEAGSGCRTSTTARASWRGTSPASWRSRPCDRWPTRRRSLSPSSARRSSCTRCSARPCSACSRRPWRC
jgi:hypothetical protein